MLFYIKNYEAKGGKLCQITVEKEQSQDHITLDFILNDNLDIDVKASDIKGNISILEEENNKKFNLKKMNGFS